MTKIISRFKTVLAASCIPLGSAAAPLPAPCNVVDPPTLAALALQDAVTTVEHKAVTATPHGFDMCTFTPRHGASVTLTVMVLELPAGTAPVKPACTDKILDRIATADCSAVAQGRMVKVALVSGAAGFAPLNAILRSHFESMVNGTAQTREPH